MGLPVAWPSLVIGRILTSRRLNSLLAVGVERGEDER